MVDDVDGGDLHVHTTASDGTSTVEERVRQARERNLPTIAITDHDRIPDRLDDPVEVVDDVTVVTGVEVRADLWDTKIEILGYFVDPTEKSLSDVLEQARTYREERNRRMVRDLEQETDLDLDLESISANVNGTVGRPHLADILVENGVVDSVAAAFREFLAEGGAAFTPMERVPYGEVIAAVREAGGVPSLAHPGRISAATEDVEGMVEELADAGLDGIEVWYPYGESGPTRYADFGVADADRLAESLDLLKTGGSDCHGPESGKFRLGAVRTPRDELRKLRQVAADRNPSL